MTYADEYREAFSVPVDAPDAFERHEAALERIAVESPDARNRAKARRLLEEGRLLKRLMEPQSETVTGTVVFEATAEERWTFCPECGGDTEGAAGEETCGCGWHDPDEPDPTTLIHDVVYSSHGPLEGLLTALATSMDAGVRPLGHPVVMRALCGSQKGATTPDPSGVTCRACKEMRNAL